MTLLGTLLDILQDWSEVFAQERTCRRAIAQALGTLTAFGRRTLSRVIWAQVHQHEDWSADYKLHARCRWRVAGLFKPYRLRLTSVLALILLTAGIGVISPFLLRETLDKAIPQQNLRLLSLLAGGMILRRRPGRRVGRLRGGARRRVPPVRSQSMELHALDVRIRTVRLDRGRRHLPSRLAAPERSTETVCDRLEPGRRHQAPGRRRPHPALVRRPRCTRARVRRAERLCPRAALTSRSAARPA